MVKDEANKNPLSKADSQVFALLTFRCEIHIAEDYEKLNSQ